MRLGEKLVTLTNYHEYYELVYDKKKNFFYYRNYKGSTELKNDKPGINLEFFGVTPDDAVDKALESEERHLGNKHREEGWD